MATARSVKIKFMFIKSVKLRIKDYLKIKSNL